MNETKPGLKLDQYYTKTGQKYVQTGLKLNLKRDQNWTKAGLKLEIKLAKTSPKLK